MPTTPVTVRRAGEDQPRARRRALRADGFHDVATAYHAISLYDEVIASPSEGLSVTVVGAHGVPVEGVPEDASQPRGGRGRCVGPHGRGRAGRAAPRHQGHPRRRRDGRGSADAAAALVACDALWQTGLSRAELAEVAATVGSDVPFSLVGGTALGLGRGELLTPVLARGRFHWVVAIADGGLATPDVYAECDRLRDGADASPSPASPTP